MKQVKFFAACLCAMAFGSCVKDADVQLSGSLQPNGEGTSFEFSIPNVGATKADGTVEDSGIHDQGISEEYAVNNVDIYLFNAASKLLVQVIRIPSLTLESDKEADLVVRYTSEEYDVEEGLYNVFAVANSSNVYDVDTQDQFLAYEDATYAANSLMTAVPSTGFLMTNRGAENLNEVIVENEDKVVSIDLERVVVKVDVAQAKDSFELKDANGDAYANIKLQNYMMVNMATNYYLFRHEADLEGFAEPSYSAPVNFGDVSDSGYVIDPYFFSKDAATAASFTNQDNFFFQPLQDVVSNPAWSMMPASTTSSVRYCLENTLYQDAQLNAYTTGIVFQAKVTPTAIITDNQGGTTENKPGIVYYWNHKFYNSVATLQACLGNDDTYIPDVDDSSSYEDLKNAGIIRLTLSSTGDYPCYYNYWIKHFDNEDAKVMGVMEFGVVRNNHYKLTISSVAGLGEGEPFVKPDQPDETNETLSVKVNVVPWIVRNQGDVELK